MQACSPEKKDQSALGNHHMTKSWEMIQLLEEQKKKKKKSCCRVWAEPGSCWRVDLCQQPPSLSDPPEQDQKDSPPCTHARTHMRAPAPISCCLSVRLR